LHLSLEDTPKSFLSPSGDQGLLPDKADYKGI